MHYPRLDQETGSLFVQFDEIEDRLPGRPLKMTLDFDLHGDILGIEVINLFLTVGSDSLKIVCQSVPTDGSGMRYSYDEGSDSFYLRLKTGRSVD
jgi:uncharacterized protein YuzE